MNEKYFQYTPGAQEVTSLNEELAKMAEDPELQRLYFDIIRDNNFERLREKSEAQLRDLESLYYDLESDDDQLLSQKEEKLRRFTLLLDSLVPVRGDTREAVEFVSPERSGIAQHYGPQDVLVHAERFVYASFSEIGHFMSRHNQQTLDEEDISPRSQIVMNDIANVVPRVGKGTSYIKKYLQNMFDYETGKKILALYLASVFDKPEQVKSALEHGSGQLAQDWERLFSFGDLSSNPQTAADFALLLKQNEVLTQTYLERMKVLLEVTGIEPPFSLEIRVKDSAKIKSKQV